MDNDQLQTIRKKSVLVIEDERPLLEAVRIKLENSGFNTYTARSIEEAMVILESNSPVDVIWLDHYLVGSENGLDLVVKIKNNEKWKNIPIFVVSNTATGEKIQSYLQLGVKKFYVKAEHSLEQIITDIRSYLEKPE